MTGANSIVAVIRTTGERTFEVSKGLLEQQLTSDAVVVVSEAPFEAALKRTYEVGVERNARWTLTLDADVLLRKGAIDQLRAAAEQKPANAFELQGRVHDKMLGTYRRAGPRVYRTEYLHHALRQIPEPGAEIRPERVTVARMKALGWPSLRIELVAGVHDYEQSFRDIYRKCFVHAAKHLELMPHFMLRCKTLAPIDPDFLVALRGIYDGLMHVGDVRIDNEAFPKDISDMLSELGLTEKSPLSANAIGSVDVRRLIREAGPAPVFEGAQPPPASWPFLRSQMRRRLRESGFVGFTLWAAGASMCRAGNSLKTRGGRYRVR